MRTLLLITIVLTCTINVPAQTIRPWEEYLEQSGLIEDIESADLANRYDDLSELAAHPIDINNATRDQLEMLPFLTMDRFSRLIEYIDKVGTIQTWNELVVADIIDERMVRLLQYFSYLGKRKTGNRKLTLANVMRYGKHEATGYFRLPCYDRKGDAGAYRGYPYRHWIRYTFNYGQDVKLALVGAQDAGEPFFSYPNNMGYDYYSFYLQLRNRGRLRSLVIGRYRIRLGSGLIINTNYTFGKLSVLSSMRQTGTVLTGHSSRSEANYLQGAAATISLSPHMETTLFASYRKIDATLNGDSVSAATLLHTGYHRTQSEIDRRHNTAQTLAGADMAYRHGSLRIGISGVYNRYDRRLNPDTETLYRRNYPVGNSFWNMGINYSYLSHNLSLSGETATGDGHGVATINCIDYNPVSSLSLKAVQRFYSYRYNALMGRSFSEGGHVNNESGVYLGAIWRMSRHWSINAYTDYAYFSWARYGVSFPSHVWDNLISADYSSSNFCWQARYRLKMCQHDNSGHSRLENYDVHRAQTSAGFNRGNFHFKTLAAIAFDSSDDGSFGWLLGQQAGYKCRWLQLCGSAACFDTDNYDSRIYCYEYGLLYAFGYPSFYGRGIRYALTARISLPKEITMAVKAGVTDYFDRDHISSGLQRIDASSQADIEMQLRFKF